MEILNEFDSNLQFNLETTGSNVNFLDVNICLVDGKLKTDIYYKLTALTQNIT